MPISSKISTAGQPSESQIKKIASEGFEVVINLGLNDPKYCLSNEAGLVKSLGLEYYHIPINFLAPTIKNLEKFFCVMDDVMDKKIFIHCAANKRVSCFVALYGESRFNWTQKQADTIINHIWQPDEVWSLFIALARKIKKNTPNE